MPALNITDLNNGKKDLDHIAEIATSHKLTAADRLGSVKPTVLGAINSLRAFNVRGAFVPGVPYSMKDVYTSDGIAYVAVSDHLSLTVAADLASGKVVIHQGATREELSAPDGASLVQHGADSVAQVLDSLHLTDFSALRAYRGAQGNVFVTGYHVTAKPSGMAGMYVCDNTDTTSLDNNATVIVDVLGRRWKLDIGLAVNVKKFGAVGDGVADDTAAIQAAIDAFPNQGTPNWQAWCLVFPNGTYKITAPINVKNQQFGRLIAYAATLIGDFDGTILQAGDTSGVNDLLWFHIEGLRVVQNSTGLSAGAVSMEHAYSCTVDKCLFYGGRFAFVLNGNANQISGTTFRRALTANVTTAGGANNEGNTFIDCSNELSSGPGYDLNVTSGQGGFTHIIRGYIEANAGGGIRAKNAQKFVVDGVYFNLQNRASGIILDGTVGASYPNGYGVVKNCRVLGPDGGAAAKFIQETGADSINCSYSHNEVEGGLCDLYGAAEKSINLDRKGKRVYLRNSDAFADADASGVPDSWALQGTGVVTRSASISPYGGAASVDVTAANQYIHQDITFPGNALLRVSAYGKTTGVDARVQLLSSGLSAAFGTAWTASATPQKLEFHCTPAQRDGATTAKIVLRNLSAGGTATFAELEIEDMTN